METEPLRATKAAGARLLGVPTRELLRLIYEHRIRYVMVDGILSLTCRPRRSTSIERGRRRPSDTTVR